MSRKDEILSRVLALAAIMQAERHGLEAREWNQLLAERWCKVSVRTTYRDLDVLADLSVVTCDRQGGANVYRWEQWPMPLGS